LHAWIVEKSARSSRPIGKEQITSFDLVSMRRDGPEYVARQVLASVQPGKTSVIVVNAMDEADIDVVVLGVLEGKGLWHHCS
jgi:nucleotide-binding universal stress UspA family protein